MLSTDGRCQDGTQRRRQESRRQGQDGNEQNPAATTQAGTAQGGTCARRRQQRRRLTRHRRLHEWVVLFSTQPFARRNAPLLRSIRQVCAIACLACVLPRAFNHICLCLPTCTPAVSISGLRSSALLLAPKQTAFGAMTALIACYVSAVLVLQTVWAGVLRASSSCPSVLLTTTPCCCFPKGRRRIPRISDGNRASVRGLAADPVHIRIPQTIWTRGKQCDAAVAPLAWTAMKLIATPHAQVVMVLGDLALLALAATCFVIELEIWVGLCRRAVLRTASCSVTQPSPACMPVGCATEQRSRR